MCCTYFCLWYCLCVVFFFFKHKTAYEMRISDWSSDVCSSDLLREHFWQGRDLSGKLAAIRWLRKGGAMAPDGARGDSWGPASGAVYPTGPAVLLHVASSLQEQLDWLDRKSVV